MTLADLEALDRADPLASLRERFVLPDGVIYLDGNSLGGLPRATAGRVAQVVEAEWGAGLIRSWNDAGWISLASRVADKIGRLIGAPAGTVSVGDSTSINVFKLLAAALSLRPDRRVILSERSNFPTDLYIAEGLVGLLDRGYSLRLFDEWPAEIADDVAVVMLTHVHYRTGAMFDMATVTAAAHAVGAVMLWDLAHSAGAVPVDLAAHDVDLAVGCGYKFLNGGPGAPAFLYIAEGLQDAVRLPLTGWFGHAAPFAFESGFRPARGIAQAVVGTPPVLSLAALDVGVDTFADVDMAVVRAKSLRLFDVFAELVTQECGGLGLQLVTPPQHGSQICLAHEHAYPIMQALIAHGAIGDFRAPDVLRFGLTPLYLGFAELWNAVAILRRILEDGSWRDERFAVRQAVT